MTDPEATLHHQLESAIQSGAQHFDPVRFCYIESLTRRAGRHRPPVKQLLTHKALEALADYRNRWEQALNEAALLVDRLSAQFPDSADTFRCLFQEGRYEEIGRLHQQIAHPQPPPPLTGLRDQVTAGPSFAEEQASPFTFDDALRRQEAEIIQSYRHSGEGGDTWSNDHSGELKAFRLFKETWTQFHTENRVQQALDETPENAGYLNTQMLAAQSLATLHELSPEYLNRLVTYLDTLLWLERAALERTL